MERYKYDIAVTGGGMAGAASAIAAARQGKKVILIEKHNCLGGAAAFDLVNPFMPYWTYDEKKKDRVLLSQGVFKEIIQRLEAMNGLGKDKMVFDTECLKYVLMKMAEESGVELLFQAYVTEVIVEGSVIKGLKISGVGGAEEIYADYFIDATGDGNIAFMAGCPFNLGRESDNLCQPMTLCFRIGNVKRSAENLGENVDGSAGSPCDVRKINELYRKFKAENKIKNPREDVLVFKTMTEGVYHFNTTRVVKLNPTNLHDVSRAEIEAREQMFEMFNFLRNNFEEFKYSVILSSGLQIGVRESRKIIGEHVLTAEEIIGCTKFEDSVAVCNYDIDIHNPDGSGTHHLYFPHGKYYTVPYRSLVPKQIDNLLVAGRCISATHEAQASLRIMPTCCTLGEAAGIAASIAVNSGNDVKNIDVKELQRILVVNGAKIY